MLGLRIRRLTFESLCFDRRRKSQPMKILKFGGSSLATTDRIRDVAKIVLEEARRGPVIVVVSAFQGVTNQLLECARLAAKGDRQTEAAWKKIVHRHRFAVDDLRGKRRSARLRSQVDKLVGELEEVLHGIQLLGHCPPRALDLTASFGERLSALIVAAYISWSGPHDSLMRVQFIVTDDHFTSANVNFGEDQSR